MPAYMSGVRGGVKGSVFAEPRLEFLREALTGIATHQQLEMGIRGSTEGRVVTIVINNTCNLRCRHCYLQVHRLEAPELSSEERAQVFRSAFELNPSLICLSGKEIFLGNRGAESLRQLSQIKHEMGSQTRIGAITNGTLLYDHRQAILDADLDNLDISVDGIKEDHDFNRGRGSFDWMKHNLQWAVKELGDRLFVNMTLQKRNFRSLAKAVVQYHDLGVRTVGCGFYCPLPYTDPGLKLDSADYGEIFQNLDQLGDLPLEHPMTVLFEVDTLCMSAMLAFMQSRWFDPQNIKVDERDDYYCETTLANGLRLQVRFYPFPQLVFKSGRITVEGLYLTAEDTVNTQKYAECSLGNVRDYGCDVVALQQSAAQAQRIRNLFDEYFEQTLPFLQNAYSRKVADWDSVNATALVKSL